MPTSSSLEPHVGWMDIFIASFIGRPFLVFVRNGTRVVHYRLQRRRSVDFRERECCAPPYHIMVYPPA